MQFLSKTTAPLLAILLAAICIDAIAQLKIDESRFYQSPIIQGSNNSIKIQNTENTHTTINNYTTPNESILASLVDLSNFISEKTAINAKEAGDHRLAAGIYRAQLESLKRTKVAPSQLTEIFLKIAYEEAHFDAPLAIKTLKNAHTESGNADILSQLIVEQIKWLYLDEATSNLLKLKNLPEINLSTEKKYISSILDLILNTTREDYTKISAIEAQASEIYNSLPEDLRIKYAVDQTYVLTAKLVVDAQTLNIEIFDTKKLDSHLRKYYKSFGDSYLNSGFGKYSLRISDGTLTTKQTISKPLQPISQNTSISEYIFAPQRVAYKPSSDLVDEFNSSRTTLSPLRLRRLIEDKINNSNIGFDQCPNCPLSTVARQHIWSTSSRIFLATEDLDQAYHSAARARELADALTVSLGNSPKTHLLEAQSVELLGDVRRTINNGIVDPVIPSMGYSSYISAFRHIEKAETNNQITHSISAQKASLYRKLFITFSEHSTQEATIVFCTLAALIAETGVKNKIFQPEFHETFLACRPVELIAHMQKEQDTLFEAKLKPLIRYIEDNKVELSKLGTKILSDFMNYSKEIQQRSGQPKQ